MKPAFPIHPHFLDPHCTPQELDKATGMTLRDYFAAAAVTGICAKYGADFNYAPELAVNFARDAYRLADAMLEARKQ